MKVLHLTPKQTAETPQHTGTLLSTLKYHIYITTYKYYTQNHEILCIHHNIQVQSKASHQTI